MKGAIKYMNDLKRAQKKRAEKRFYDISSIMGNDWAMFYVIIGPRMTGKSYQVTEFLLKEKIKYGKDVKNYWMRISETSTKAMLANKADKLVDPDLKEDYKLDLKTKGMDVFNGDDPDPWFTVIPLSQFGKLKGVGFYNKNFKGYYNIVLDEFQLEKREKRTSFDILYNFIGMCENIARTTKNKIRVFLMGNTLEEASTILKAFNFLPEKFGRFYLKSKRCVIDNLEPTAEYLEDRYGSIADILGGNQMSNYTNELSKDKDLIYKGRLSKAAAIIKFGKDKDKWYTLWEGNIITRWKGQTLPKEADFCMIPYIDSYFNLERKTAIIDMFNARCFKFDSLITQAYFTEELSYVKKA